MIAAAPPQTPGYPFIDAIQDALDFERNHLTSINDQIKRFGPVGLVLEREKADRTVKTLTQQLAAELARAGGRA